MFRYTYNTLAYGHEPLDQGIARLARFGYDGVELIGEPDRINVPAVRNALAEHGLVASSIVSIYTPERDIVSSDQDVRKAAVRYVKENIDLATELGAEVVTFTPTACMKINPEAELAQEWAWAVAAAKEVTAYAADGGVRIAVEPWNRYETYLITRVRDALRFIEEVDAPNIGVMADTFHMSIEEPDVAAAIRSIGPRLSHLHLADSNRAAPGEGHLDFRAIMQAIIDIEYQHWVSYELLPAAGDVWTVLSGTGGEEFKDPYTEASITRTKALVRELTDQ